MKTKVSALLIALTVGLQVVGFSQTEQGKLFLGGSANFNSNSTSSQYTNNAVQSSQSSTTSFYVFNFTPKIGVFVVKNLAVGVNANVNYADFDKASQIDKNLAIGPLLRYYFKMKKSAIFLEAAYNYGKGSTFYQATSEHEKTTLNMYSGGVGFCYFLKENVGLELMYQYEYINQKTSYISQPTSYSINLDGTYTQQVHNFNVGLMFYF